MEPPFPLILIFVFVDDLTIQEEYTGTPNGQDLNDKARAEKGPHAQAWLPPFFFAKVKHYVELTKYFFRRFSMASHYRLRVHHCASLNHTGKEIKQIIITTDRIRKTRCKSCPCGSTGILEGPKAAFRGTSFAAVPVNTLEVRVRLMKHIRLF